MSNLMMVVEMIVVVIVPITVGVPALGVNIPPAVTVFPAPGAGFREFVAGMLGL